MPEPFTKTIEVRDDIAEVGRVQRELTELWEKLALPADLEMPVGLALEEVLSNVLRHGRMDGCPRGIRVTFNVREQGFEFEVSDAATPFDPLARPEPDITLGLDQRRPGGLGVFIVKKLADELNYERREDRNHLRFLKYF